MIVTVTVKLNIDPDLYEEEYGISYPQIKADMQKRVQQEVQAHYTQIGVTQ